MSLERVARRQYGVVTAEQAMASGLSRDAIRWRLARGRWQILQRGVYLTHNGPFGHRETAQAVLLRAGSPAALSHESALWVWRLAPAPERWTVLVPNARRRQVSGADLVRSRRFTQRTVDGLAVTSVQRAIVDVADRPCARMDDVIALVASACQRNVTTAHRLLTELADRRAHRRRRQLRLVLGDVSEGIESLAEHRFLHCVVRAHGLPSFTLQRIADGGRVDFDNAEFKVCSEVDGLAFHSGARFRADRLRDRRASARGVLTVRSTWWDVEEEPCDLARDLAHTLRRRGWAGRPIPCSPTCPVLT